MGEDELVLVDGTDLRKDTLIVDFSDDTCNLEIVHYYKNIVRLSLSQMKDLHEYLGKQIEKAEK